MRLFSFHTLFSFLLLAGLLSCKQHYKYPRVLIKTSLGEIEAELYPDKAPLTVAAFLSYVDSGYYDRTSFYRVLNTDNQPSYAPKAEIIQGGLYGTANKPKQLPGIPHESTKQSGLKHLAGTLSMARLEPGTASSEFFICLEDQPGFDYGGENNPDKQGYAAFGRVLKGMDVVRKIYNRPEYEQRFDPPIPIVSISRE